MGDAVPRKIAIIHPFIFLKMLKQLNVLLRQKIHKVTNKCLKRKAHVGLAERPSSSRLPLVGQSMQRKHRAQHSKPREFPWRPQ